MPAPTSPSKLRSRRLLASPPFWLITAVLLVTAFLHHSSQIRAVPISVLGSPSHLTRHALERVLLLFPVAYGAFAFGLLGGLLTLLFAVLIMLPRVLLSSPYPADAFFEMIAVSLVGGLVSWLGEAERRERKLRQEALRELEGLNAIAAAVSQSLDLEEVLASALDQMLHVMGIESGGIYLLDEAGEVLTTAAHRGLSPELIEGIDRLRLGEGFSGRVAQTGQPLIVRDVSTDPRLTRMVAREEGYHSLASVPLAAGGRVVGTLFAATRGYREFRDRDIQLLCSIGVQIGVAVQNAQLYDRERQALERSRASEEQLRFYARHVSRAQEDERKRVAQELHDDTAQILLVISRRLEALATSDSDLPVEVIHHLEEVRELTRTTLHGVRRFSQALRPPVLDDLGLVPALEGLVADVRVAGETQVELEVNGDHRRLSSEAELSLYRIAQEALRNVERHSGASRAVLIVDFNGSSIRVTVRDNGKGFELPEDVGALAHRGKLGVIGMRERAELLGGTLTLRSEVGEGTMVVVEAPV